MTQNNLGNALSTLGAREPGTARLEEAVAAYRDALTEGTRDRVPLDWAFTMENLGLAQMALGERTADLATAETAIQSIAAALAVFREGKVAFNTEKAERNLAEATAQRDRLAGGDPTP
jgi:hypothetical protein